MRLSTMFGLLLQLSCAEKPDDSDDDQPRSQSSEGANQGDCLDGIDNDDDGYIDCEDQGCVNRPACEEADTAWTDTDTDTEEVVEEYTPDLSVNWGTDKVTLNFTNPQEGGEYYWGITENGGCDDCWTGEDCFMGYDHDNTTLLFCHPVGPNGVELAFGATGADTVEGETTTFGTNGNDYSGITTYILDDRSSTDSPCWVWGVDVHYYTGYEKSCTSM